ncbi:hypothetical protein ES703_41194 [subsurface metagenome]
MKEVPFSIPVSGIVRINGDSITIIVNKAETNISLTPETQKGKHISLEPGQTLYDVILGVAREVVRKKGFNRFSAPELYQEALDKYPELKRNSFITRVIACTPDHSSYKHYTSKRDYFSHIGPGLYKLNDEYRLDRTSDKERNLFNV